MPEETIAEPVECFVLEGEGGMKKCYHSLECGFVVLRPVCNFSNYPKIIAYLFGRHCPFEYSDHEQCVGFIKYFDPRQKEEDEQ